MNAAMKLPLTLAALFGVNIFLWWSAQSSPWWLWAISVSAGMIVARADEDIKARWRKRRQRRSASTT